MLRSRVAVHCGKVGWWRGMATSLIDPNLRYNDDSFSRTTPFARLARAIGLLMHMNLPKGKKQPINYSQIGMNS